MQVTREVLDEIGAGDVPWILVLNKIDKVAQTDREALVKEFPAALLVSAKDPADVGRVREAIIGTFEADMTDPSSSSRTTRAARSARSQGPRDLGVLRR